MSQSKYKDHYAPRRWKLAHVAAMLRDLWDKYHREQDPTLRTVIRMRRELEQQKKHIIFFQEALERLEKTHRER